MKYCLLPKNEICGALHFQKYVVSVPTQILNLPKITAFYGLKVQNFAMYRTGSRFVRHSFQDCFRINLGQISS